MTSLLHRPAVAALVLLLCPLTPSPAPSSEKAPHPDSAAPALSEPNVEKKID